MEIRTTVESTLLLNGSLPIEAFLAGMLISRGSGRHIQRICSHFDLIFVREGVLPIQEEERTFEVRAGESLLLWPGRRHGGTGVFSPDLRFYWLHFNVKEAPPGGTYVPPSERASAPPSGAQTLSLPQYATVRRPDFLESLFRRYLDDQETGRLLPAYASLLAWLMLCEIADQRPMCAADRTAAALAGRALAFIRSHLHQPLKVSDIADALGYNPEYLNRVFHQTYHHTLTQEIHLSRIGYARYLLLYSSMNVSEIAHACGFADASYFFRLFKRYEGMTAMAFRRLNAQARVNFE